MSNLRELLTGAMIVAKIALPLVSAITPSTNPPASEPSQSHASVPEEVSALKLRPQDAPDR